MAKDFLPSRDGELLAWSANFDAGVNAAPTTMGLTTAQATEYTSLHLGLETAMAAVTNPATRTRGAISAKDAARTPLKAKARELARIINAFPPVTNQMRIDLGLNPRNGSSGHILEPTEAPALEVVSAFGRTLNLKLHPINSSSKGKPKGVQGATVFSFVGATPPAELSEWKFEGNTTRTHFEVEFLPSVAAGSQVWLTAFWTNPRGQSGPACVPISAYLAGGAGIAQAA